MSWVIYFFETFLVSLLLVAILVFWLKKTRIKKKKRAIKRLGGVAMIVAFFGGVMLNPEIVLTSQILGLLLGLGLILIFGIGDDWKNFSWKKQLLFQFVLILVIFVFGYSIEYVTNPFGGMLRLDGWMINSLPILGSIILVVWLLFVINAINWVDGIDGLSGGLAIIGGGAIFILSLTQDVNQPAVAIISLVFLGSVLGFLVFNFPKAKIFAGTSGSYFFGFFLATVAVIAGTKIATAMIILAIPIVDAVWVMVERVIEGTSITRHEENSRHLHYKLRKLGWSDVKIIVVYLIFTSSVLFLSIVIGSRSLKIGLLTIEILFVVLFLYIITLKIKKITSG